MKDDPLSRLENYYKEYKEDQELGLERIKEYYEDQKNSDLDVAPHTLLRRRAEKLWMKSQEVAGEDSILSDSNAASSETLKGVSFEILLKAFTLKEESDWFIRNCENGQSPNFAKCIDKTEEILREDLEEKSRVQFKKTLKLIKEKRNNAVHLNLHNIKFIDEFYFFDLAFDRVLREFPNTDEAMFDILQFMKGADKSSEYNYYDYSR